MECWPWFDQMVRKERDSGASHDEIGMLWLAHGQWFETTVTFEERPMVDQDELRDARGPWCLRG